MNNILENTLCIICMELGSEYKEFISYNYMKYMKWIITLLKVIPLQ